MQMTATHEPTTTHHWYMQFTSHARSVALVRDHVQRTLTTWGCGDDDTATAILVCSELATNAVRHGHVSGRLFEVRLDLTGIDCTIEVSDASRKPPIIAPVIGDEERGRGLHLVSTLTSGRLDHFERHPIGKTIRANLKLTAAG
jgi:anti-sigma regulatory factor (Ser/Thr protein kinase)